MTKLAQGSGGGPPCTFGSRRLTSRDKDKDVLSGSRRTGVLVPRVSGMAKWLRWIPTAGSKTSKRQVQDGRVARSMGIWSLFYRESHERRSSGLARRHC